MVEHEGQDVLVVGNGDDALQNELAVADDSSTASSVVGVLPTNTTILLMDADDIGHFLNSALVVGQGCREVLNGTETVTSKLQVVGHDTCTNITKIEGSLLVEGVTRIAVRNRHVGQ